MHISPVHVSSIRIFLSSNPLPVVLDINMNKTLVSDIAEVDRDSIDYNQTNAVNFQIINFHFSSISI